MFAAGPELAKTLRFAPFTSEELRKYHLRKKYSNHPTNGRQAPNDPVWKKVCGLVQKAASPHSKVRKELT
jgi:hypothetical protein